MLDSVRQTPDLGARELHSVLSLISRYHHHLDGIQELDQFIDWLCEPDGGLRPILVRATTLSDRYLLARGLHRLYDSRSRELIIRLADAFLAGAAITSYDLGHIRRLDTLLDRCYRESGRQLHDKPLNAHPQVQDLLESPRRAMPKPMSSSRGSG